MILTGDQLSQFHNTGFVRLSQAFSSVEAAAMENTVWKELCKQFKIERRNPSSWYEVVPPIRLQHLKGHEVFRPIGSTTTLEGINDLLGPNKWTKPWNWGQFLVDFPSDKKWEIPTGIWHTDFEFDTSVNEMAGLLILSIVSRVAPQSGGTLVLEGSHRLVQKFIAVQPARILQKMSAVRKAFLSRYSWLRDLTRNQTDFDRKKIFMEIGQEIESIPLKVSEITGEPGDVIIAHPWLFHTSSSNCSHDLKIMRVQRIHTIK